MPSSWIFARLAYYPSLVWGIAMQSASRRWYDRIDSHVVLGALPFKSQTKELVENENVGAVITLNEDYELWFFANNTQDWADWGVEQLHLRTVDFNNAPSQEKLKMGVEFIEERKQIGKSVYVHCKAGRGRSATLVACYLMKTKGFNPKGAYDFIKSKRPHILIGSRQWEAIELFHQNLPSLKAEHHNNKSDETVGM